MNEQIRELASKAGYTPLPGFDFANGMEEVFITKFAELIVRECMNATRGAITGLDAFNNIKEHFGVEE